MDTSPPDDDPTAEPGAGPVSGPGPGRDAGPVGRTGLEVIGRCVMDHRVRREMLIAALAAWGMVLIAMTVCVGLLAASSAVSLAMAGTAALGTATAAGTTVAIRRRRRPVR